MSREIKTEHFFCTRVEAKYYYNERRRLNPTYNLIKFTYFGNGELLCYYLVTTRTLMSVICESYDYLGMLARYSLNELGYEPVEVGYFLAGIEVIDF
nr:MAG TPA: hypothetical protein [Bacteriophage sp.]